MMKYVVVLWLAVLALGVRADLDLRSASQVWDVGTTASKKYAQLEFYRGESYSLNLQAKTNGTPVNLSATNLLTIWELVEFDAISNGWLIVTGSVASATGGIVRFELTPAQTDALAPGMYRGEVWSIQQDGTNIVKAGLLAAQRVEVLASASGRFAQTIRAPYPWEAYSDLGDESLSLRMGILSNAWKNTDATVQWLDAWQSAFSNDWTNSQSSVQRLEEMTAALSNDWNASTATLGSDITSEASARISADASTSNALALASATLGSNISAEASARISADSATSNALALASATLGSNITSEAQARISADASTSNALALASGTLGSNIASEASARIAGDAEITNALALASVAISSNLAAEVASRSEADGVLTTNIAEVASELNALGTNLISAVACAGGWYNPDWFSLATNAYPYLILGEGATQAVNSVYVSDVIVDSAAGYLLEPSVLRMSTFTGGVVFAAESNCTIQTVTVTNPVGMGEVVIKDAEAAIFDDDLPSGTVASVTATLNGFSRTLELTYQPSNLYVYSRYQGDVAGTLRALVNTSLAARAANTNMSMDLYLDGWPRYGTNGTWVRNTNCWAYGIDLTCASPYNTQGNQAEKGGTAITRQHIVFADHYQIIDGTSVLFVDSTNGCHWRRVEDSRKVLNTDCRIGILDEPLPASIHPAQVLRSSDDGRFLGAVGAAGAYGVRTVHFKAVSQGYPKVFSKWACYSTTPGPDTTAGLLGSTFAYIGYTVPGHPFSRVAQGGDSGQPVFLIIGTNTVLYSTFHSAGDGPNIGFLAPHIEQILREGFGYESVYTNISYVDLSAWRNYNLPPTP